MMKKFGLVALIASLAGCGGLEISSLSVEKAENAHKSGPDEKVSGYIVYHPMIVVAVKKEKVITEDGTSPVIKCVVGKPQTLPDYEKPFLLRLKPGIGKSSVDLKIEDGWRLAGIKTEADNTAWLTFAKDMATGGRLLPQESAAAIEECKPGLYRLSIDDSPKIELKRIPIK